MEWLDYRKKLGLGFNDEEKANYFYAKILNILNYIEQKSPDAITEGEYIAFCNMTGTLITTDFLGAFYLKEIIDILDEKRDSLNEFIAYFIAFINSQSDNIEGRATTKEVYKLFLIKALKESHIMYEVLEDEDGYFVFPAGDPMMDKDLVSDVLLWLDKYSGAKKTYVNALKQYADGIYTRDVADNLRKALETFLQEFLQNDKNLENNKGEICRYLASQEVDSRIGGMYESIISTYKDINNKTVKHNDKLNARLLEFLLYQTGLLIRMVLRVSGQIEGN
jgi:hypothetical protein